MPDFNFFVIILLTHLIADFFLQSREIAENKHRSLFILTQHVTYYSTVTLFLWLPFVSLANVAETFALFGLIFGSHFVVDYITSKAAAYFKEIENTYLFAVTYGIDQTLHYISLVAIFKYFI